MPDQQVDLAIVGLGAMGAAIAWQAAVRGLSVAGFDALAPPHTSGSTHGHSRIIREAYFEHPQYVPLVQRAYALWAELEKSAGTRLFQASGGLMIGRPGQPVVEGTLRAASEHRLPVQTWTADDIRTRVPALAPDRRHGRRVRAASRRAGAGTRRGRDARPGTTSRRARVSVRARSRLDLRSGPRRRAFGEPARARAAPGIGRRSVAAVDARRPHAASHRRACRPVPGMPLQTTTAFRRRGFPSSCSKRRTAGCSTGCRIRGAA